LNPKGEILPGRRMVKVSFTNVTQPFECLLKFSDADGVHGERHVVVNIYDDKKPEVQRFMPAGLERADAELDKPLRPEVTEFLVTQKARIPWQGLIKDDHGLNQVTWEIKVYKIFTDLEVKKRPIFMVDGSYQEKEPDKGLLEIREPELFLRTFEKAYG